MTRRFRRRINDGDYTGIKQDKFRNSDFEYEDRGTSSNPPGGVPYRTLNTLGGVYQENRGRRNASERLNRRDDNPFENGRLYNWNHRQGWDRYFDRAFDKEGSRSYGGGQLDHDGAHVGKGPKGYKRSDEAIYEDVCQTLTMNPFVDASDIEVTVKDGHIFLKGTVETREVKKNAELSVENISGVVDVQNMLSLSGTEMNLRREQGLSGAGEESRH